MRVIAGQYGGRVLEALEGDDVRPTLDRAKETLFNVLQFDIDEDTRVLDMFAGSGALGIEALSRGAGYACFFDANPTACEIVKRNLEKLKVPYEKFSLYRGDFRSLSYLRKSIKYDIIFLDPPYAENLCEEAMKTIVDADLLGKGGLIVCEHPIRKPLPEKAFGFNAVKQKKIGIVGLTFYKRSSDE